MAKRNKLKRIRGTSGDDVLTGNKKKIGSGDMRGMILLNRAKVRIRLTEGKVMILS